jgi:hypothetical protein
MLLSATRPLGSVPAVVGYLPWTADGFYEADSADTPAHWLTALRLCLQTLNQWGFVNTTTLYGIS